MSSAASSTTKTIRAAIYARVSTTGHGQDVGLQVEELRAVAQQRGWTIVGEYIDEGVSGGKQSRPALDKLMAAARSGKLDVIVVWRFDRFARSTQHLLSALEEFRVLNVSFVSMREQVDTTTPVGKVLFTLIAAISEFERALIQERVRAGVARAQAAGTHCGRPRVEIDVRPALALLEKGHSLTQVARMLRVPKSTLLRRLAEVEATSPSLQQPPVQKSPGDHPLRPRSASPNQNPTETNWLWAQRQGGRP